VRSGLRRRLRPLKALLGAALAAAACSLLAGCGGNAVQAPNSTAQNAPSISSTATPRPHPTWSAEQRAGVARSLSSILNDDILVNGAGIAVVAEDGTTLFARHATKPYVPASTLKLVVGATALDELGPAYRFPTSFVALAPPDADGLLHGPLWLVGSGDPLLSSDDLRAGVGALHRAGVRAIEGPLYVDASAFAGPERNPHWDPDDADYDYAPPTSAISLDQDDAEFDVTPGAPGEAAKVAVEPANESVTFTGTIATVDAYDSDVSIERSTDPPAHSSAAKRNAYVVGGYIVPGEKQKFWKPIVGVPEYVGGAAASMLAERGIALGEGYRAGSAPLAAVPLWVHRSQPLAEIVRDMLVNSNNHTAEQLLRVLGERSGRAGSDAAGIAEELRELDRLGVPRDNLRVYDGSGLAPDDHVAPLTLAKLIAAEQSGPAGGVFVRTLARVGLEGTAKHHDLTSAAGRVRAKTGHIDGVNGLAGTAQSRHHGRIAFDFIVNDPRADADVVTEEEDSALDRLSEL
jgi:D-alanyl-D-alanine carboxypeptidase/D-alanyl-D-alanine-endopeptidase (penicillin-binding protein 4)